MIVAWCVIISLLAIGLLVGCILYVGNTYIKAKDKKKLTEATLQYQETRENYRRSYFGQQND